MKRTMLRLPSPISPNPIPATIIRLRLISRASVTGAVWGRSSIGTIGASGAAMGTAANINIDCNHCFNNNNFNGKININDVDWKNVDRSKINFDKNQINHFDRNKYQERPRGQQSQQHQEQGGRSEA